MNDSNTKRMIQAGRELANELHGEGRTFDAMIVTALYDAVNVARPVADVLPAGVVEMGAPPVGKHRHVYGPDGACTMTATSGRVCGALSREAKRQIAIPGTSAEGSQR